jgi:hypothetical protein
MEAITMVLWGFLEVRTLLSLIEGRITIQNKTR